MLQQTTGDLEELPGIVILELILIGEASHQSGIGVEHGIHLLHIACEDDEHVGIRLREHGEQRVDDTGSKVLAVASSVGEGVSLVDEEHVAPGLFEDGLHVLFGLTDVTPDKSGSVDSNHLPFREQSQRAVDLAKFSGDCGLARTWITSEDAVEGGLLRGGESTTATLSKEPSAGGHLTDAPFHLVETDHRVQVLETLLVGRLDAGELVKAEVAEFQLREVLIADLLIAAGEVTRLDLFDDEPLDIVNRPGGEDTLATALEQRMCQSVHGLDGTIESLVLEGSEEGVHLFEILGSLLFQAMVAREESSERGKHVEHCLDVRLGTADPEQILIIEDAEFLDDLLDDDLASRGEETTRVGQTEDVLACGAQLLIEHLVRIVTGGVEERAAIDMAERVAVGHERMQLAEVIGREIAVARHDQQMAFRAERLTTHFLAELIVDLELLLPDNEIADLRHTRPLRQTGPIEAVAVDDGGEDILLTTGQTGLG